MGYHIEMVDVENTNGDVHGELPCIVKDGGTGSWREAKKTIRKWYLDQAAALRTINEKTYFN